MPFINFHFIVSLQEVGSIIGKKGEIVKRFREEVSPKIYINFQVKVYFYGFLFSLNEKNYVRKLKQEIYAGRTFYHVFLFYKPDKTCMTHSQAISEHVYYINIILLH